MRLSPVTLFLAALLLAKSLLYWIAAAHFWPGEPLEVTALYRLGDIQYYPSIGALSRGSLSQDILPGVPDSVFSLQILPLLPHAIFLRLFGSAGFIVADAVVTLAFFFFTKAFLARIGAPFFWASLAAFVVSCSVSAPHFGMPFNAWTCLVWSVGIPATQFWGMRISRPFVSGMFYAAALAAFVRASFPKQSGSRRAWILAGVAASLALQADWFSGFALTLAFAAFMLTELRRSAKPIEPRFVAAGIFAGGASLVPFAWQRSAQNADLMGRLGFFSVDRLDPWFLDAGRTASAFALLALSAVLSRELSRYPADATRASAARLAGALAFGAWAALPVMAAAAGKLVQIYHFQSAFDMTAYTALFILLIAAWPPCPALSAKRRFVIFAAALGLGAAIASLALPFAREAGPPRKDHIQSYNERYRESLASLVRELKREIYADARQIGTLDHSVFVWWLTFRGGRTAVADAVLTRASDAIVEERLAAFAKLLGMDERSFRTFLHDPYTLIFLLGHDKYQASRAYTFSPLEEYRPEDRQRIAETPVWDTWRVALPVTEEERLARIFAGAGYREGEEPDLVVTGGVGPLAGFEPPGALYERTYANDSFIVWKKR